MANHKEARVKLANTELNKLKPAGKYKTRTTLRILEKLSRWGITTLFLSTRQKTKIRNAFTNNMSTDIKLS